jgi:S1-C subfamily serine protease
MRGNPIAKAGTWTLVALLLAAAVWALAAQVGKQQMSAAAAPRQVVPRSGLHPGEQATIELFEKARGSVVFITTQARIVNIWTRNMLDVPRGSGSGFLWDDRGHIVTNNHVVFGASGARVRLSDGREIHASLVGVSPAHDLAVIRVDAGKLPEALPVGTTSDLRVGQAALAIGNPFGLDWTLTTGIVSALDRSLPTEDGRGLIEHLIQTDAAINPGNSGGPLLDSAGRLIGVNVAIFSPSGASAGVGFAIPVDTVNRVVPQLIRSGKYVRPVLGVQVDQRLNEVLTQQLGVKGVAILEVTPGSGAERAGLQGLQRRPDGSVVPGDIIVAVNNTEVDSAARLLGVIDEHRVGDVVQLSVVRAGRKRDVQVTLQAAAQ